MTEALSALRAAAVALLAARGERDLAEVVAGAGVEVVGPIERWSMGSREVSATRLALVVEAPTFAALSSDGLRLAAVKEAFASAARTPETELADLALVLRLPGLGRGWHRAYRDAPARPAEDAPNSTVILGGAAALLEAGGDAGGAGVLRRAVLEIAAVPGAQGVPFLRCVVRLDAADLAALERDAASAARLRGAVRDAAARPTASVASVELGAALGPELGEPTAEARLARALAARGAIVVPVSRRAGSVVLAVVASGDVRLVEIAETGGGEPRWRAAEVEALAVSAAHLATAELAHEVAAIVCGSA